MKELGLRNITLMAAVAGSLIQLGAQLFAVSMVASTLSAAPPRSLAILEGAYRYDSEAFWQTVPLITFLLLVIAVVANWKTPRRKFLLFALTLFVSGGLLAGIFVEPMFDDIKAVGYRDEIDPLLQSRAMTWYALDWAMWGIGAVGGASLLLALVQPAVPMATDS